MPKPNLSTRNRYFVHGSELVAQFVQDSNERKAGIHPLIHFELYLQDPDAHGAASLKSPVDGGYLLFSNFSVGSKKKQIKGSSYRYAENKDELHQAVGQRQRQPQGRPAHVGGGRGEARSGGGQIAWSKGKPARETTPRVVYKFKEPLTFTVPKHFTENEEELSSSLVSIYGQIAELRHELFIKTMSGCFDIKDLNNIRKQGSDLSSKD
uniref:Uncharacterized protein n=1 Tax=Leersia perrieri TaxID=77586 RepID=A0A0D9XUA6_9ORYZ